MRRRALLPLVAVVLAGLWGGFLGLWHLRGEIWFLDRVEATMVDIRTLLRGPVQPPNSVALVAVDDDTARGEGKYPLSRATLARLIDEIGRQGASAVALDILLLDVGEEEDDRALAQSLARNRAVIAAAAVFAGGSQWVAAAGDDPASALPEAQQFLMPLEVFSAAAPVGVVNVATDPTGTPRFAPLLFRSGERLEMSLPLKIASVVTRTDPEIGPGRLLIDGRTVPTDRGNVLPLNFYGPRGTIPTLSAAAVLAGKAEPGSLRGRIVVIGSTVTGGGDVFPTPFDAVFPGAEVVATAIANLMGGDGLVRDGRVRTADAATGVVLPMLLVALLAWRRSVAGLGAIAGVVLVWLAANAAAFAGGVWLSVALPITAAGVPLLLFGAVEIWRDRLRAQHFATQSELLQRVQAPGLSAWLAKHRDFLSEPVQEDAAVIFIDLSGYTGLSETLGPAATRDVLSAFHILVDEEVTRCGGVVTNFMGDGAMILFGLPEPAPDDALKSTNCLVHLANRMNTWLAGLPPEMSSRLGFKIGAHHGTIVASRLGGAQHQHISATGDTVNVASRLMEVAADYNVEIAMSDELLRTAGPNAQPFLSGRLSGPIETAIRGRAEMLSAWLWTSRA
jgi:adenylate cyclase